MTNSVFDASTALAYLLHEPIIDLQLESTEVYISAVNYCEVRSKIGELPISRAEHDAFFREMRVVNFTESHAVIAAELRAATKHLGLSLGDRACLSLALERGADVYTADRAWLKLELPCRIVCVRP